MEFFNKSTTIKLRSHLDKYLLAEEDQQTVRQSRNESSKKALWTVEFVEGNTQVIRLKSIHGQYLTASQESLLLGMTGKKVFQTSPPTTKFGYKSAASLIEWEPIREGFQVKLRSRSGSFLRGNGATRPWRNTVTHDIPSTSTYNWVLWEVISVDSSEIDRSCKGYESQLSSFSSLSEEGSVDSPRSPWSVEGTLSPIRVSIQV